MFARKLIIIIIMFFIFLDFVKAEEISCPYDEQLRLRELAALVTFSFDFVDYEESSGFDVYAVGMTKDLFIKEEDNPVYFHYNEDPRKVRNRGFSSGTGLKLDFYATTETQCPNFKIITIYLQVPYYNYYSEHPLCKGYEESPLCQRFSNVYTVIEDNDEFEAKMNAYLDSLKSKDNEDSLVTINDDNWFDKIVLFIQDYSLILLLIASLLIIGNSIFIRMKKRRNIL